MTSVKVPPRSIQKSHFAAMAVSDILPFSAFVVNAPMRRQQRIPLMLHAETQRYETHGRVAHFLCNRSLQRERVLKERYYEKAHSGFLVRPCAAGRRGL